MKEASVDASPTHRHPLKVFSVAKKDHPRKLDREQGPARPLLAIPVIVVLACWDCSMPSSHFSPGILEKLAHVTLHTTYGRRDAGQDQITDKDYSRSVQA